MADLRLSFGWAVVVDMVCYDSAREESVEEVGGRVSWRGGFVG